ncbi:hypothetical protein F7725_017661, partial [Dissostichus mawsoni]
MSGGGGTVSTVGCKSVPAVDQHGSHVRQLSSGGPADKGEDGQGVLRDPHVGPLGVMILKHRPLTLRPRLPAPLPTLHDDKKQREEEGIKALNRTRPFSTKLVIMTMTPVFCSHTIRQKSSKVDLRGPWAAMFGSKSWTWGLQLEQLSGSAEVVTWNGDDGVRLVGDHPGGVAVFHIEVGRLETAPDRKRKAFHKEGQELTLGTTSVHSILSLIIKGSNEAPLKPRIAPSHTLALLILNLLQDVFVIFAESSATMSSAV